MCQAAFLKAREEGRRNHGAPPGKAAGGWLLTEGAGVVAPAARLGQRGIVSRPGLGGADATGVCLCLWHQPCRTGEGGRGGFAVPPSQLLAGGRVALQGAGGCVFVPFHSLVS